MVTPRKTERQRDRETERWRDGETERQIDRETERQRDRVTEKKINIIAKAIRIIMTLIFANRLNQTERLFIDNTDGHSSE